MALNFSEWKDSLKEPQYQIEGKKPKCQDGYKWNKELKTCVPDTKNGENPGEKECPDSMLGYDVFGATGLNGDGYAIAVEEELMYHASEKDKRKDAEAAKRHKEQDDRMRYGKKGKPSEGDTLRPGEVKRFDKKLNRWVSNKEGK